MDSGVYNSRYSYATVCKMTLQNEVVGFRVGLFSEAGDVQMQHCQKVCLPDYLSTKTVGIGVVYDLPLYDQTFHLFDLVTGEDQHLHKPIPDFGTSEDFKQLQMTKGVISDKNNIRYVSNILNTSITSLGNIVGRAVY